MLLNEKWYSRIQILLQKGTKKKHVPDVTKVKTLTRFYDSISALMSQNLSDITIRTLHKFTEFICDIGVRFRMTILKYINQEYKPMHLQKSNPGFRLTVLLEDEDTIVFSPNFAKMQTEILRLIDMAVNAVKMFQRIECKVFVDVTSSNLFLRPAIPPDIIESCRTKIYNMLEDQRIGPELRLHDFDAFLSLMNGEDAESIIAFMKSNQPFSEYCKLIVHYKEVESSIASTTCAVVSMGLYEFNRTALIETLETLSRYMQTKLLTRMVQDQQGEMAQLESEYEAISNRALAIPKDTAELMASKAFVTTTDNKVIPEMEDRLRIVSRYIKFVSSVLNIIIFQFI